MECGKQWRYALFVHIAIVGSAASCRAPLPPPQPLHVPPPSAAVPEKEPRWIHPGLLRGLMTAGELHVAFEGDRPDDDVAHLDTLVEIRTCLDREGNATHEVAIPGKSESYRTAVLAAVAAWRFRPYTRDGVALAACSSARFMDSARFPHYRDALPAARVELPLAVERPVAFPRGLLARPPTPGVAFARVCRKPGSRAAPTFTLLQSSGDAAFDRTLFEERATVLVDEEAAAVEHCWLRSGLAHVPDDAFDFEKDESGKNVPPVELELERISGNKGIFPSDRVKNDIAATRENVQLMVPVKVCVDRNGRPARVTVMKSSGHFAYDMDIINGVAAWRYKPLPVRQCSAVQFIYRQKSPVIIRRRN